MTVRLSDRAPLVSVVVPTRNRRTKLLRCVDSVLMSTWKRIEVIVVDDASDYDVSVALAGRIGVRVLRNKSRVLLSRSRNRGASAANGEFLFFLDDDNLVAPTAVEELVVRMFGDLKIGVCAPVIYEYARPTQVWTSYIRKGPLPGFYVLGKEQPQKDASTFSFHDAFMVSKKAFETAGEFNGGVFPIHFSELDFAYRLRSVGYKAIVTPRAKVWHDIGEAHMHVDDVRAFYTLRNRIILLKKYETGKVFRNYVVFVLPALSVYYALQYLRSSYRNRFHSTFNLVKGIGAGLAYHAHTSTKSSRMTPRILAPPEVTGELPMVSVIIPSKNASATIEKCLESVMAQSYQRMEVIVVDNSSRDDTVSIAKSFKNVKVYSAGSERSSQFNFGAGLASGRFLYRVDADFIVEPGVVEEAVMKCVNEGYKVVTVHNTSDPRYGFWARVRKLERDCYVDDDFHIAARFFDRAVFESVGGFDPVLVASEDYDLHNRLTARPLEVGRIRSKEVHIGEPRSLSEIVRKHFFYGTRIGNFIRKTPSKVWGRELNPIRMAYLRHWKSFLEDPRLTAGFLLYQYVRYSSAMVGYISSQI